MFYRKFVAVLLFIIGLSSAPVLAEATIDSKLSQQLTTCITRTISQLYEINAQDEERLFRFFLNNIDQENFGRYNYKRAWIDWQDEPQKQRLALRHYFELMLTRRDKHTNSVMKIELWPAEHSRFNGNGRSHILARITFTTGEPLTIAVLLYRCKAVGFIYGGTNLRSFVSAQTVEAMHRQMTR